MSEQQEREGIELLSSTLGTDAAFGSLMDALAPEEGAEAVGDGATPPAGTETPATDAPAGGAGADGGGAAADGQPAAAGVAEAAHPPADAGGPADGSPAEPAAVSPSTDLPADWTATPDELIPKLGELSKAVEDNLTKAYQQQAFEDAKGEYEKYFEALEKHPRLLVGTDVPAIGKEGMERLRDTADAKEWQEAVRSILGQEIRERAESKLEESGTFLETVHASIDLFKNNKDLIPGTKTFDKELADTFAAMATPYEVRVEGKLQGYSIPVQPIIDNLRTQLSARRTPAAPPAAATGSPTPAAPAAALPPEPPQAGIPSKAGSSGEKEDFSTLFGTIGLPHLQI